MICVSLPGPTAGDLMRQIQETKEDADLFEFRCDLYSEDVTDVMLASPRPKIICHHECLSTMQHLAKLEPEYIDLDQSVPLEFQQNLPSNTKIIRSIHFYDRTPQNLDQVFESLTKYPADLYKMATYAQKTTDSLRLLKFSQSVSKPLSVVAMGELGQCTRILGASFGLPIIYTSPSVSEKTAPGQISVKELVRIYSTKTDLSLYGLIGDPISQSFGHLFHNAYMRERGAIYVRLRIQKNELDEFFDLAKELPFEGLSVTIPHKVSVFPFLSEADEKSKAIGAVNTMTRREGGFVGTNTDAAAAVEALAVPVKGKRLVVLGAGGAARAIVYEAISRGADVVIVNRHHEKAVSLSREFGCEACRADSLPPYDILINATPSAMPIEACAILPNIVAMDISTAPDSQFLQAARKKGGRAINGREMFERQANMQAKEWGFAEKKQNADTKRQKMGV